MPTDDKALFEHLCADARAIIAAIRASHLALGDLIEETQLAVAESRQTLRKVDAALAGPLAEASGGEPDGSR